MLPKTSVNSVNQVMVYTLITVMKQSNWTENPSEGCKIFNNNISINNLFIFR